MTRFAAIFTMSLVVVASAPAKSPDVCAGVRSDEDAFSGGKKMSANNQSRLQRRPPDGRRGRVGGSARAQTISSVPPLTDPPRLRGEVVERRARG